VILTHDEIKRMILEDKLIENYVDLDLQLQSVGFDVTVHKIYELKGFGLIDFDNSERKRPEYREVEFENDRVFLSEGSYVVEINEIINLPNNIMAIVYPRSTLVRCGATIASGIWDPGYRGRGKLCLFVGKQLFLKKNARIGQMIFIKLEKETKGYLGFYLNEGLD